MVAAFELLDYAQGDALIGDTGYDSNDLRAEIRSRGIKPVIHSKPERKRALPLDRKLYKLRYLVELFFQQSQTVSRHRNALRENAPKLPRAGPGRVHLPLARIRDSP